MSKKLIIAISALALAILAGAIAVVGVFAAQQQKVANTFTITYTADNVSAFISSCYWYKSQSYTTGATGMGTHTFTPEEAEQTFELKPSITLSASEPGVMLWFWIENRVSHGGKKLSVTLTDTTAVKENVNVYYAVSRDYTLGPMAYTYAEVAVEANKTLPDAIVLDTRPDGTNAASCECYVFIVIEIADTTLDAKYETTKEAGLHFILEAVDG